MKQLSAIWMLVLIIALVPVTAFGQAEYLIDGASPLALAVDTGTCQTVTIILDPRDVITTPLVQAGFWLVYDPDQLTSGDVIPWDWNHGGPWDPGFSVLIPPDPLSGTYFLTVGNFDTVPVDLPIPICDIELCCEGPGQSQITISTIPAFDTVLGDDTTVWDSQIADGIIDLWQIAPACSCEITGPYFVQIDAFLVVTEQYTALPAPYCVNPPDYLWRDDCYLADVDQTGLLHVPPTTDGEDCTIWVVDRANTDINTGEEVTCEIPIEIGGDWWPPDEDWDGVPDCDDNCPAIPNGYLEGTCTSGTGGENCNDNDDCGDGGFCSMNQEDSWPPQGNSIGDACDCEGDFDCDEDVDGTDAATLRIDFGRSTFQDPCTAQNPCNGDFDCDQDCDGSDAALFKSDFGRHLLGTPCPSCVVEAWCVYQ